MFRLIKAKTSQKFSRTKKDENIISGGVLMGRRRIKNTNSVFLPDDVLNDMKQMNPQQLVEFLSVTVFCHGLVTKLFSAEASCCQPPSETSFVNKIVQYSGCNVRKRN